MAAQPPVCGEAATQEQTPAICGSWLMATVFNRRYRGRSMITTALRPVGHIAAWLVWHSTGISLLADLDDPAASRSK